MFTFDFESTHSLKFIKCVCMCFLKCCLNELELPLSLFHKKVQYYVLNAINDIFVLITGCYVGEKYSPAGNARSSLEQMLKKLLEEDRILRTYRRSLGFSQVLQKDLAPLLVATKEDTETFRAAVRLVKVWFTYICHWPRAPEEAATWEAVV